MPSLQLPNHLVSNRKRLALSQDDVAFLLGTQSGTQVSRYEAFNRTPNLKTALAFEAIFKLSVSELFPGIYQKVEREIAERAKILVEKQQGGKATPRRNRKHDALLELANI
jgi:transcriptional regulator with XRE-family HTH domain